MQPLDTTFSAVLVESPADSDWAYVVMPGAAAFLGVRGLVKVRGTIDGEPFTSGFVALGDGRHKLPVSAAVRRTIGKETGDTVTIRLTERTE